MALPPAAAVSVTGSGPTVVLVHGSATDATTFAIQQRTISDLRLVAYHRRGTPAWPAPDLAALTTRDHATDLEDVLREYTDGDAVVCGSSFGAVIVLELLCARPLACRAAILCEPPLAGGPGEAAVPQEWLADYERVMDEQGGPAAAELFLRTVLTDEGFEALPRQWQQRSKSLWRQIDSDIRAAESSSYPDDRVANIGVPVVLLSGSKSPVLYRGALEHLQAVLPRARRVILDGAGHMMHVDRARRFADVLRSVAADCPPTCPPT